MVEPEIALEELRAAANDLADLGVDEEGFLELAREAFEKVITEHEAAARFDPNYSTHIPNAVPHDG
jgi:hypothetical protein